MMLHIPDVLTRQQVTAIRTAIDAADWVDGRATAGSQGARVKRNRQLPEDSPVALEQGRTIEQALAANALYFSAALPARTMSPLFTATRTVKPMACTWTVRHGACQARSSGCAPMCPAPSSSAIPRTTMAASWSWWTPTARTRSSCRPAT